MLRDRPEILAGKSGARDILERAKGHQCQSLDVLAEAVILESYSGSQKCRLEKPIRGNLNFGALTEIRRRFETNSLAPRGRTVNLSSKGVLFEAFQKWVYPPA